MNLNEIAKSLETVDREVEFRNPNGEGTGWFFTLRHESSPEVQSVLKTYKSKVRDASSKNKSRRVNELIAENEISMLVAHVAGWRWAEGEDPENGRPPFSKRELREVLEQPHLGYHVRKFIEDEVGSVTDFLEKSANN